MGGGWFFRDPRYKSLHFRRVENSLPSEIPLHCHKLVSFCFNCSWETVLLFSVRLLSSSWLHLDPLSLFHMDKLTCFDIHRLCHWWPSSLEPRQIMAFVEWRRIQTVLMIQSMSNSLYQMRANFSNLDILNGPTMSKALYRVSRLSVRDPNVYSVLHLAAFYVNYYKLTDICKLLMDTWLALSWGFIQKCCNFLRVQLLQIFCFFSWFGALVLCYFIKIVNLFVVFILYYYSTCQFFSVSSVRQVGYRDIQLTKTFGLPG